MYKFNGHHAAFTSFGGWGDILMGMLQNEKEYHAKKIRRRRRRRAAATAGSRSGQRWKQDLLERASIAIAKERKHAAEQPQPPHGLSAGMTHDQSRSALSILSP